MERCAWCGYNEATDAHHLFRRSTSPELIDDPANKIKLCWRCHKYATDSKEFEQLLQTHFFLKPERELTMELVESEMKAGTSISPRDLARYRNFLAAHFASLSDEIGEIEKCYPLIWTEIRAQVTSDTQAERLYDGTPQGIRRTTLKIQLKKLEKMMSSLKTTLDVMNAENRNLY
jgi:hypothetical protein